MIIMVHELFNTVMIIISIYFFFQHIQFYVNIIGHCKIKHLSFETIFDMLEYFRVHGVPVESRRFSDITLASFVSTVTQIPLAKRNWKQQSPPLRLRCNQNFLSIRCAHGSKQRRIVYDFCILKWFGSNVYSHRGHQKARYKLLRATLTLIQFSEEQTARRECLEYHLQLELKPKRKEGYKHHKTV